MISLRQVKSLLTVVETGSVTRAAESLCLAPSSVSAQLKELSAEVGVSLFETHGRALVLSAAGQQLLPKFQHLLAMSDDVINHAQSLASEPVGELRLYAPSSMCIYRVPPLIEALQTSAPAVELHLQHDPFNYTQALDTRAIEAAIVVLEHHDSRYQHQRIASEEVIYVVHPSAAIEKPLSATQLSRLSLITTEPGCSYRVAAENHFKQHALTLTPKQSFSNVEVIRRCLLARMGIGLLPRCVVQEDLDCGRLLEQPVIGAPYKFHSTVIWPKEAFVSPRLAALLAVVNDYHKQVSNAGSD